MAKYGSTFSVVIPYETEKQKQWLLMRLESPPDLGCALCDEEGEIHQKGAVVGGFVHDFEVKLWSNLYSDQPEDKQVWCRPNESGDLSEVADLVCEYQTHFSLVEPWFADQAFTCSKLRLDGFGGNSVLCYRGKQYWCDPHLELEKMLVEMQEEEEGAPEENSTATIAALQGLKIKKQIEELKEALTKLVDR